MKNNFKKYTLISLASVALFFLLSTWIAGSELFNGMRYAYEIGFPFHWLTIYSVEIIKSSVFSLIFEGNDGVSVNLLAVFYNLLICFAVVDVVTELTIMFKKSKAKAQ